VIGTFAIYYREPRSPSPREQDTIKHITYLAASPFSVSWQKRHIASFEQVARGQVEALAQSLDVWQLRRSRRSSLADAKYNWSALGRQAVSLWLFDELTDSLFCALLWTAENWSRLNPEHPFMKDPLFWKQNAVIQELLFTQVRWFAKLGDGSAHQANGAIIERKGAKRFLGVRFWWWTRQRFVGIRHADQASYRLSRSN